MKNSNSNLVLSDHLLIMLSSGIGRFCCSVVMKVSAPGAAIWGARNVPCADSFVCAALSSSATSNAFVEKRVDHEGTRRLLSAVVDMAYSTPPRSMSRMA